MTFKEFPNIQLTYRVHEAMIAEYLPTLITGLWTPFTRELLVTEFVYLLFMILLFPLFRGFLLHIWGSLFTIIKRCLVIWIPWGPLFAHIKGLFSKIPAPKTMRCTTMAMASPSRPTHMQLQSPLFRLPRELRDQIYGHYLYCESGLEYDFDKNKLTWANGEHIDLSLTYACRQAAAELHGLTLRLNTVTFRSTSPGASRYNIGMFDMALHKLHTAKNCFLVQIAQSCLTDESERLICLVYPQFAPLLRTWRLEGPITSWIYSDHTYGEPPSVYRDFVNFAWHVLKDSPHFSMSSDLLDLPHLEPWQHPGDEALEEVLGIAYARDSRPRLAPERVRRAAVSAAGCAIRFMKSLPTSTRSELRQVDLIENRESMSHPERHVRGLIPYCQENEKLRIHRRVDLLWNVLWCLHWGRWPLRSETVLPIVAK